MEFQDFPKMARLSREIIVTEKIDGTNAQICIGENGEFFVGSRTRWITPDDVAGLPLAPLSTEHLLPLAWPGRVI